MIRINKEQKKRRKGETVLFKGKHQAQQQSATETKTRRIHP